ncbi:sensor histidine kinase [Paracoccus alcaliphilus]|nr:sensor histidine kinase [Paracoccus alcaliphilus]WCR17398.1 hypothetical protein JHW40_13755 [Paracoccus alcaliphilus]
MSEIIVPLIGQLSYPSVVVDLNSAGLIVTIPPEMVIFDLARVGFVEPSGVVMLHNLTRFLIHQGCRVAYRNYAVQRPGLMFLDGAGFFEDVLKQKAFVGTRKQPTTLSLREIRTIDAHGWVQTDFLPWLSHCSRRSAAALGHFGSCISEIFNNIRDHSAHQVGSIFAQWYPNIDTLKLAVGDFGRGIPATVATVEPGLTGAAAIERAFAPNFTSQSTPKNRGAGLDFTLNNVCIGLNGMMTVYSGGAALQALAGGQIRHLNPIFGNSGYTGTLFEIILPTHAIPEFNPQEEEMIW